MELLRLWSREEVGQMDFLLTSGVRGIFDAEAESLGARLHYIRYGRGDLARFLSAFRALVRNGRYDAIHDHCDYASGWHFLCATGALPPVRVTHVHNPWLHIKANYAITPSRRLTAIFGKRLVNLLATHINGTSAAILQEYGFEPGRRQRPPVNVVHCGINVSAFNRPRDSDRASVVHEFGWQKESKIILFVGRIDRATELGHPQNHKNSWFAINVVRTALSRDSRLRLLMAGAGDQQRSELERRISAWGLKTQLKLIGIRRDIPRLMRAADVLLFPSVEEGLGMVAVEAQAANLPVLASTAVPKECVVVPELYRAMSLDLSLEDWAEALIETSIKQRPSIDLCQRALEESDYSIVNSAQRLIDIYESAKP
jgi:glycosyltransferase EpsF